MRLKMCLPLKALSFVGSPKKRWCKLRGCCKKLGGVGIGVRCTLLSVNVLGQATLITAFKV
jgi:hypothetical protein